MGIQFGTEFQGGNMKIFLAVLVLLPLALAFPAGDQPFLNIKVSGPGVGGSFGTSVSKQKVELEENGKVSYEPYHPHVPPSHRRQPPSISLNLFRWPRRLQPNRPNRPK